MLNSLPSLALIDAAFILPICIWILKGVFDTVPPEVLDAAVVDGCTQLSVAVADRATADDAGLVAVAVVSFFFAWNEYLYASIMLGNAALCRLRWAYPHSRPSLKRRSSSIWPPG